MTTTVQPLIPGLELVQPQQLPAAPELPLQGITREDVDLVQENLDASQSESTRRNYSRGFKRFEEWCQGRGLQSLPAAPETVAVYLSHRAETLKKATVQLDRAAIADVHCQAGLADPCSSAGVKRTMQGIAKRKAGDQAQARGLTSDVQAAIRATACQPRKAGGVGERMESAETARRRGLVDIALVSAMRDGLLRRSEAQVLTWGDLELSDQGGHLMIRRSKTDPEGVGADQFLGPQTCQDLLAIRPEGARASDLVFAFNDRTISRRIRAAALHAGAGDGFSGHSCRIGMAQDLEERGASMSALMNAGRWKTPRMPSQYTRKQQAARGPVAQYYGVTPQGAEGG